MLKVRLVIRFCLFMFFVLCFNESHSRTSIRPNSTVTITKVWDLEGKTIELPENTVLFFDGGYVYNGTLIGNNTIIKGQLDNIFSEVKIDGIWKVPFISTRMFQNLDYDNSLRDVLALTNKDIFNEVSIADGTYYINIDKEGGHGLLINDKTSLKIDGELIMRPNSFLAYNIIKVIGNEVMISGRGTIIGDKFSHQGTEGEWGMGILVRGSKDVSISNLTIKNCWGDCIYVGINAENILIDKCSLDHGRRQGISVTSGTNITISNCNITNINGTLPQYGIDIEPNKGEFVGSVIITGCSISKSYGGIKCWGGARGATIKSIDISNCKVVDCEADHPIIFEVADTINMKNCYIEANFSSPIYLSRIKNAFITSIETKSVCLRPIIRNNCGKVVVSNIFNKLK